MLELDNSLDNADYIIILLAQKLYYLNNAETKLVLWNQEWQQH